MLDTVAAMNTNLDVELRDALVNRRGDWLAIARQSGISYSWLSKFANGHIPNPGYETLKKLYPVVKQGSRRRRTA